MGTWLAENAADLPEHLLTLIGIALATIMVVWQLRRQHRSSLLLQRDNAREALKLKLHELLVTRVRALSSANAKASMYAFMIPDNIENYQRQLANGIQAAPVRQRALELSRLNYEASIALTELIQEFEAWSIAFPGLKLFQTALNSANYDAQSAYGTLFSALNRSLPFDPPKDAPPEMPRPFVPKILSTDELTDLRKLVDRYSERMNEIGAYVHDLTVEAQNNLLSNLFERHVSKRQPIDPNLKVITTEPDVAEDLLQYFENDTAWGRSKQATEADVRSRFS